MNHRTKEWSSQDGNAMTRFGQNIGKVLSTSSASKRAAQEKAAKAKAKKTKTK